MKWSPSVLLFLLAAPLRAQDGASGDLFYRDGKYAVVFAVVLIILIGLFAVLFRMERRLTRLEKDTADRS